MSNHVQSYTLGAVEILGPTASEKQCSIFIDLAGLLGCEYTSDAVEKLKFEWSTQGKKGKIDIDAESDYVSIHSSKSAIIDLAFLINNLANNSVNNELVFEAKKVIKKWKQPEPFPWEVGDIFRVKLQNEFFVYGQVLGKTSYNAPTCVLFSVKTQKPSLDLKLILNSVPISILHVQNDHLNDQSWKIIGNSKPILDPGSGPCGVIGTIGSKSWDGLEILAKAWHGIRPWNEYYKDDFLDKFLLEGVQRPADVVLLNREQLKKFGISREE